MTDEGTLPPHIQTFWDTWGSQIDELSRLWNEQRYGCWCGPGNVCSEVQDDMDACCKAHDEAYGAQSVTSADPPASGYYSMWDIEGLKRTMEADATLVACVTATEYDTHLYGPTAALYRVGVQTIFGGRAAIAAWLWANGY